MSVSNYKWPLMKNSISILDRIKLSTFILTSNNFTQGKKVRQFEDAWTKWLGSKHSLYVTSGSTANFLLISALIEKYNLNPGDKVLLPACTWVTNINPIFQLGLQPIFCDINLINYSFDEENLKRISEKHTDIKVVFVTHLLGLTAPVEKYKEYFPDAIFIDDVCESHGCLDSNGNRVGSNSIGATFSFYFGHHMSTIEGGMISTNDSDLYDIMKMKRSHGLARVSDNYETYIQKNPSIEKSFLFVSDGYNFRNTEIGAVLGLSQLKRLGKFIENRRNAYLKYVYIANRNGNFYPVVENKGNSSFCFPFICKTKNIKQKLITLFEENGIEYRPIVGGNLLKQPYLQNYSIECPGDIINADTLHENGIYIGNNQFVTSEDLSFLKNILDQL